MASRYPQHCGRSSYGSSAAPSNYQAGHTYGTSATTGLAINFSQHSPSYSTYGEAASTGHASYTSEPLSRYGSSEGSSQSSSTPTSPMSNTYYSVQGLPYAHMSADVVPAYDYDVYDHDLEQDFATPRTASEDRSTAMMHSSRDHPVCCLSPDCTSKPFKRRADLDRHYKHRHAPESQKEAYCCDYGKCARRHDPFHRRDHFRDHLREFHKEDIEKRGGSINEEWLEGRYMHANWWRCPRCLKRVYIDRNGYDCPSCKTSCQQKRKEARRRD